MNLTRYYWDHHNKAPKDPTKMDFHEAMNKLYHLKYTFLCGLGQKHSTPKPTQPLSKSITGLLQNLSLLTTKHFFSYGLIKTHFPSNQRLTN